MNTNKMSRRCSVHALALGPFGCEAVRCLGEILPARDYELRAHAALNSPEDVADADILVLASWRPASGICRLLNEIAFKLTKPFVPFTADSSTLRLGPVIVPGSSGCWSCWERRMLQHEVFPAYIEGLLKFYDSHLEFGPKGFFYPFAMLGAARIARVIMRRLDTDSIAGHIWQFDSFTMRVSESNLLGIHGCANCGLGRSESDRSYVEMRQAFTGIWEGES